MDLSRRQFVMLGTAAAAGAAVASGCDNRREQQHDAATSSTAPATTSTLPAAETFDAGPASEYAADRVYDAFRGEGFFLVRRGPQLTALSSVCTHKGCKVRAQGDGSYLCKCHGSRFDRDGRVINPPAKRDLPRLSVSVSDAGRVLVQLPVKPERGGISTSNRRPL